VIRGTDLRRFVDGGHLPSPEHPGAWSLAPGPRLQSGYTLIEVIVAFAVLALALTLLLGTLSGASKQVRWADDAGRASLHAQSLIDQLGVGEALAPGQRQGDFENGRFRWQLDVSPWRDPAQPPTDAQPQDLSAPSLLAVSLRVAWGDAANQQLQVSTLRLVQPEPAGVEP
jgi:general secretion pathway protein I